jgi:hypothetical protein
MLHSIFRTFTGFSIDYEIALVLLFTGIPFYVGCESTVTPTSIVFLNHSGRAFEGEVRIRDEAIPFAPFSCTIVPIELKRGDAIQSELTDIFSSKLLKSEDKLLSSRQPGGTSQSLLISIEPGGKIAAIWQAPGTTDHAIHADAMHRLYRCLPVAVQPTGTSAPCKIRIHQRCFQYTCFATMDRTSASGYLTTDSNATTYILMTYKDAQGSVTKIASIADETLQEWVADGTNGLSIWLDAESDTTSIYKMKEAEKDSYILSQRCISGGIPNLPVPIHLPLTQSRKDLKDILTNL